MDDNVETLERDIFDTPADNTLAKAEAKKLLLPEGWYTTELPTTLTPRRDEETGRRVARFFATIINNKQPDVTGKIGFGMSPDVKYKEGEDKADWNYRMFLGARKAFIEATGAEPATDGDVIRYVETYPIQVRVVQTESDENMIVAFRAVKGM